MVVAGEAVTVDEEEEAEEEAGEEELSSSQFVKVALEESLGVVIISEVEVISEAEATVGVVETLEDGVVTSGDEDGEITGADLVNPLDRQSIRTPFVLSQFSISLF